MYFRILVQRIISRIVVILFLSAVAGIYFDQLFLFLFLSVLTLLAWHYRHLFLLIEWLWRSKNLSPPQSEGIWGQIFDGLYRQNKQHRKKHKQLNDRLKKFRDGAEALPDAALVLSNDLIILWGNKKAQHILGVYCPSDIGQRVDNLIRSPEFSSYLHQADFQQPCSIPSPNDSEKQIEIRLMTYGHDQVLFLARDISKVHRIETMRRDFVANVSHELKTPLTVVRGYLEMISIDESQFSPQWLKVFSTMELQVSRMDRLVEQLLILSKIENNLNEEDDKKYIDMPALFVSLQNEAHWLNQDKQHNISFNIDKTLSIKGIEHEIKSACTNLVSNAISYTAKNGEIDITWQRVNGVPQFTVKDNGEGIRTSDVNRLTERFYRIDPSRSRNSGGSGLGLAIVKHVLNNHGAQLKIKSEWKKGSEFSIVFNK